jgi:hypothetical protein
METKQTRRGKEMRYELLTENFVNIIGVETAGRWVWTVTSTCGEATPGLTFNRVGGIDEAFSGFSENYESNVSYFSMLYVEGILRVEPDRVAQASEIYEALMEGFKNLVLRGLEEMPEIRHLRIPLSLDRRGVILGSIRKDFDLKDFFRSPSKFRAMHPKRYFRLK